MKRLGQEDLLRQMLRIKWTEQAQLLNHFRTDSLWLAILRAAVHHAMPNRCQCISAAAFLDPVHQNAHRRSMIRCCHHARKVFRLVQAFYPESGLRLCDALNSTLQNSPEWVAGLE